jgi:hypothetical protein
MTSVMYGPAFYQETTCLYIMEAAERPIWQGRDRLPGSSRIPDQGWSSTRRKYQPLYKGQHDPKVIYDAMKTNGKRSSGSAM